MSPEPTPRRLRLRSLASRWQGVVLTLVIGTATFWLAATGQLVLYIHPRYVVFTVIMTALGMALALLALATDGDHYDDEHETAPPRPRVGRGRRAIGTVGTVITCALAIALVVLPPSTLTSATAATRGLGTTAVVTGAGAGGSSTGAPAATDAETARYTVLQWADTLRQTSDISFYENKQVDVTGFISPSTTDPQNTFFVTRFVITCCAVDAQPVGVLVYSPNWRSQLASTPVASNDWVHLRGAFATNSSTTGTTPIALIPRTATKVAEPHDPYLT